MSSSANCTRIHGSTLPDSFGSIETISEFSESIDWMQAAAYDDQCDEGFMI